jgi:hypothetical protein
LEFKVAREPEELMTKAEEALRQMEDRKYDSLFEARGLQNAWKYGVAFCGKQVKVLSAQ